MRVHKQFWNIILAAALNVAHGAAVAADAAPAGLREPDFNEQTHLVFVCEEEKLARDIYHQFAGRYPEVGVFAALQAAKEHSRCEVEDLLRKYQVSAARVNDNVGVFSWGLYGRYFTEAFLALSTQGSLSLLNALYVGAFLEELNIQDIRQCPKVIVDIDNGINDAAACGWGYTRNPEIRQAYDRLLDESRNHLQLLARAIEQQTGAGSYQAQVLQQAEVDAILARRQRVGR